MTEADTCRTYVVPKLHTAGWSDEQIREQVTFTDGRIVPLGKSHARKEGKRADYVLRYRHDFPIAIVEAKAEYKKPGGGLQQAMEYAEILGLRFAYSTNGKGVIEHDYTTGREQALEGFPSPDELWKRLRGEIGLAKDKDVEDALFPFYREVGGKQPRYYQEIAINRTVQVVVKGQKRILITMATGTGKTFVAFQIVWKLWKSRRKTKILYLADRNVLVDQAKDRDFTPLGDAVAKIQGRAIKSREVYFAIYQAIADREGQPGLFRNYPSDFFDLIIVDECHRGSAKDESNWREILEYFDTATQIGMTATPKRDANVDTYNYFGDPIYTYSLRTGIDDGFLAPYRVQRVIPSVDATGWRPSPGELDRLGREIPDGWYGTKDFERFISLFSRTQAVAKHLTEYLRGTDRMAKTIVFCVDQEHAEDMRLALAQENADLVKKYPHYVARVVSDEKAIGRGYLDDFSDPEKESPVILTTSQMLTTGVDAPTCKNIVLFKPINSIVDFKQIIGRGTRVREDFGKLWFTIIDYTGATALFADPEFDGEPVKKTKQTIDNSGNVIETEDDDAESVETTETTTEYPTGQTPLPLDQGKEVPRKYYVDNVSVWVMGEQVFELDPDGHVFWALYIWVPTLSTSDSVGRETYKTEDILSLELPLPSLPDQRRIVARVDALVRRVEEARGLRRAAVGEAEAVMGRATSHVLDEQGWQIQPLETVLAEPPKNGLSPQSKSEQGGRKMLRINAVSSSPTRFVDLTAYKTVDVTDPVALPFVLRNDDVFIVRYNGDIDRVAKAAIFKTDKPCDVVYPDKLIRLRAAKEKISPDFLVYALGSQNVRKQIEGLGKTTAGQIGVSGADAKSFQIPVPPLPDQRRIVAYLDGLQAKVDELRRLQAETQKELDALMPSTRSVAKAFAGEL